MSGETVQVLSPADRPVTAYLADEGDGRARAVVWPGVGATLRTMHLVTLAADRATRTLEHASEAVYYVVAGSGRVHDGDTGEESDLRAGSMVHVEPGTSYRFGAGADGLELVGGPGPADPALYEEGT